MMGYGTSLGFGLGSWLVMAGWMLLMVAAVVLVVWLIGRAVTPGASAAAPSSPTSGTSAAAPTTRDDDPLAVLRMRFAHGELSRDEYLAAKRTLEEER